MPELDLRTVTFLSGIYCLVFGIGLLFVAHKSAHYKGLYTAAIADFCVAASMLTIYFRGIINTEFSIQLTNAFITIAIIVSHRAILLFRNTATPKTFYLAYGLLALQIMAVIYYTYHQPNLQMRIVLMSFFMSAQFLLMAKSIYYIASKQSTKSQKLFNHATALFGGIFFARAVVSIFEPQANSFFQASFIQSISLSTLMIFVILKDFSLFINILENTMAELIQSARTDPLTKLYNRRGLTEIADRELSKLQRHAQPLTLVICDLDDFKCINDSYGHATGDLALVTFAQLLLGNTRDIDICARLGGDEFVMIFPNTALEETAKIVNKMKQKLAATYIDKENTVNLSASFGIANYHDGMTLEQLIHAADQALYSSKSHKHPDNNVTSIKSAFSKQSS